MFLGRELGNKPWRAKGSGWSLLALWLLIFVMLVPGSCGGEKEVKRLPILGQHRLLQNDLFSEGPDTLYHSIPEFRFLNQDSQWVTEKNFLDKIYVADFFFTSCPTICPVMAKNMLNVYETYKDNPEVGIISHTIDPEYDTVSVLRKYAEGLQVHSNTWHFLTGEKKDIYTLAKEYLSVAVADSTAPGGYLHSGHFLLVDKRRRIRGVYDGTSAPSVDTLIEDIAVLLKEYK